MKIAYITSQFPVPSETFAAGDVLELVRLGHEVRVFGFRPAHRDMAAMVSERGLDSVPIQNCSLAAQAAGLVLALVQPGLLVRLLAWLVRHEGANKRILLKACALVPAFFFILSRLRRMQPGLVHLFWGHYPSMLGFMIRETMPQVRLSMFLGAHDLAARLHISAEVANQADYVFTHAKANLPLLEEMGIPAASVTVVHRGVDTVGLDTIVASTKVHKDPGLVLSAGRLQPYKGFDDTLRIFAGLREKDRHLQLAILGDGPYKPALITLAEELKVADSVRFLGHLPHAEVIRMMAEASLFLFMSRHDGERLPNSVKEAMFCRCICISTNTVGMEELVEHGRTGFIVPMGEVQAAIELAGAALSGAYPAMAEAARQAIIRDFSRTSAMKRYMDTWTQGAGR
jgi:glycosyltransferase involved in cell wall biosynthesis